MVGLTGTPAAARRRGEGVCGLLRQGRGEWRRLSRQSQSPAYLMDPAGKPIALDPRRSIAAGGAGDARPLGEVKILGDCRSNGSTARSGRRCATAAASAASTSSRTRIPASCSPTNVACRLLDRRTGQCSNYRNRRAYVSECVRLTNGNVRVDRLAAHDLRLSAARRGRAAARLALSGLRRPRGGPPRGRVGPRLDGQRGRRRRSGAPSRRPRSVSAPIEVVRHPRARRAKLSFDPASGRARLTIPERAAAKTALAWARRQGRWLEAQRARLAGAAAVRRRRDASRSTTKTLTIVWVEARSRTARRGRRPPARLRPGGDDRPPRRDLAAARGAAAADARIPPTMPQRRGVAVTQGRDRRCARALGQLRLDRRDPLQLAAGARARQPSAARPQRTKSRTAST